MSNVALKHNFAL